MNHGANVSGLETFVRQVFGQDDTVVFFDHSYVILHHLLQFPMVGFARAEFGNFLDQL